MTAPIAVVPAMPNAMLSRIASETHFRRSAMRAANRTSVEICDSTDTSSKCDGTPTTEPERAFEPRAEPAVP